MLPSALARFLVYLFLLALAGTCIYRFRWSRASDAARRLALILSLGLLAAIVVRAWAYTYSAFGLEDSMSWDSLRVIAVDSRWGGRWQYQLGAALLAVVASGLAYVHRTLGLALSSVAVLSVCAALPLTGHAVSSHWTILSQAVHAAGACTWLGTLMVLALVREQEETFRDFAPVAVIGVTLIVTSGAVTSALYLPSLSALWESLYGSILVLKVVFVALALACGYANWRKFRRGAGRSWVQLEIAFAVLVLAFTGWLTGIDQP